MKRPQLICKNGLIQGSIPSMRVSFKVPSPFLLVQSSKTVAKDLAPHIQGCFFLPISLKILSLHKEIIGPLNAV
jgi:hypothetical protein